MARYGRSFVQPIISRGEYRKFLLVSPPTNSSGTLSSSVVVNKPAGVVAGNMLIVAITTDGTNISAVPSGWTLVSGGNNTTTGVRQAVYTRVVDGSEGASFTWTLASAVSWSYVCYPLTDAVSVDVAGFATSNATPGTTATAPSVSPASAGDQLLLVVSAAAITSQNITPPGDFTELAEVAGTLVTNTEIAVKTLSASGATGSAAATLGSSANWVAGLIALTAQQTTTITPSVVSGVGSVQSPVIIATPLPAAVAGTGTVQAPTGLVDVVVAATVNGTGTVQKPALAPTPAVVAGVGAVQASTTWLKLTGTTPTDTPHSADSAALSITSDIDIRYLARFLWQNTTQKYFVTKWAASGDGTRSWAFGSSGVSLAPRLIFSLTGIGGVTVDGTAPFPFADNTWGWIRCKRVAATGVVTYSTAPGYLANPDDADFTQLGDPVTGTSGSIFDGTRPVHVGSLDGLIASHPTNVGRVQIRDATALVWDANFAAQQPGTLAFTESSSQAATVEFGPAGDPSIVGSLAAAVTVPAAALPTIAGTGTVQSPVTVEAALPAAVGGTGTVQSPTGVEVIFPALVAGTGTVQAPAATDLPVPASVAGVGAIFAPLIVEAALPANILGVGIVQTPVGLEVAFPSSVNGIGTVQAPVVAVVGLPSMVAGTGSISAPLLLLVVFPSLVAGVGTVPAPATGDVPSPAAVTGSGSVFAALLLLAALPAPVIGTGTVQGPVATDLPVAAVVAGVGTVQPPVIVEAALPANVAGVGSVQPPVIAVVVLAASVNGIGTVLTALGLGAVLLASINGIGAVQAPTGVEVIFPANLAGTGTVFTPAVATSDAATIEPTVINGQGTVQAPIVALVVVSAVVAGVGTIFAPKDNEVASAAPVAGVGTVAVAIVVLVVSPSPVGGVGTVFTPAVTFDSTIAPAAVFAIGTVQSPSVRVTTVLPVIAAVGLVMAPQLFPAPATIFGTGSVQTAIGSATRRPLVIEGTGTVFAPVATAFLITVVTMVIQLRSRTQQLGLSSRTQVVATVEKRQRLDSAPATTIGDEP